jgi:hypothetical protein
MAELLMPYRNLNHALKKLRAQVSESIPYAIESFPTLSSPQQIFNYLKPRLKYVKDPKGIELFQTLPTLLENNEHGQSGAGDCDCFTIAALATLLANGFLDCGIVLAGRNSLAPVHIYAYVDYNGSRKILDLTNRVYDYERDYPYKQHIPFRINQNEKDMMLQLAEGEALSARPRFKKFKSVQNFRTIHRPIKSNAAPGYIHFPGKGVQIREDYFDGMSAGQFQNMCLSEGVELSELEELSSRRSERQARKNKRLDARLKRKDRRQDRKDRNADAKNLRKLTKAQDKGTAKINRSLRPRNDVLKNALNIFAPKNGGGGNDSDEEEEETTDNTFAPGNDAQNDLPDNGGGGGGSDEEPEMSEMPSLKLVVTGILSLAAGAALGTYIAKRKYKRAA